MSRQTLAVLAVSVLLGVGCGDTGAADGMGTAATTGTSEPATSTSGTTYSTTVADSVVTTGPTTSPSTTEPAMAATTAGGSELDAPPPSTTEAAGFPPETVGSAGVGDSFYPLLGNGGYDVLHYEIELDVDPAANTIGATTALSALATHDLSSFNLDLSGLDVEAVAVNGHPAAFSRVGSEMTVQSPVLIPEGEPFSVVVSYSGTPEPVDDPGVPFITIGWQWVDGVIFTVNQPSAAMSWFPGNNHPTDKATFTFRITVPAGTTAAATGVLVEEVTDNGSTTAIWQMDDPMATYLAAVYIRDFERRETLLADGLLIRDYVPPDFDPTLTAALSIAPDAIRYFETIFGPYPFDAYGTLVLPFETGYALENQTLSVHGSDTLDPYIIAHEVMHQWIGNSVAIADWSDIWMNEGFAFYIPFMFLAESQGLDLNEVMAGWYETLLNAKAAPPKGIGIDQLFDFYAVYGRGALTLHALRVEVGDPTFLDILRTHYERAAGAATDTGSFLRIVDELAGRDAVELTRSWLFDTDIPEAPAALEPSATE